MKYDFDEVTPDFTQDDASANLHIDSDRSFELYTLAQRDLDRSKAQGKRVFDAMEAIYKHIQDGDFTTAELLYIIYTGYVTPIKVPQILADSPSTKVLKMLLPITVGTSLFTLLSILQICFG